MPYGSWVNDLPTGFFLVVHIAAFAIGAGFAWLAYKRELGLLGAAFSLFADTASPHTVRVALIVFTCVAALAVLIALVRLGNRMTLTTVALALILGGALGNVHDRVQYGSVIDFIEVHIFNYHWPDFNVADSSIVTGACLLLLDSLLPKREHASAELSS